MKHKNINPIISVIVPVYNVEKYLHRCIDSILAQTFIDFELLLIDDGSQDKSGDICDEYSEKNSRTSVIHQQNQGVTAARWNGVISSRGLYICFVDADDALPKDSLYILYNAAKSKDVDILVTSEFYKKKDSTNENKIDFDGFISKCEFIKRQLIGGFIWLAPHGRLFKRDVLVRSEFNKIPRCIVRNEDMIMNILASIESFRIYVLRDYSSYIYHYTASGAGHTRTDGHYWCMVYDNLVALIKRKNNIILDQIQKELRLFLLDRMYKKKWQGKDVKYKRELINYFSMVSDLKLEDRKRVLILKYPYLSFILKCLYFLLKKIELCQR